MLAQTLVANEVGIDLPKVVEAAAAVQPATVDAGSAVQTQVLSFLTRRLEQLLVDRGCGGEAVRAILAERVGNPALAAQSSSDLQVPSFPKQKEIK